MSAEEKKSSGPDGKGKAMERLQFDVPEGATQEQVADMITNQILGLVSKDATDQD